AGRDPAEDAGVFFYAAQRLLDGGAPYRDIWDHKPPGVYFVDAVGIALAGRTGVWFVQIAYLVAAVLLGHRALRREFGGTAAFVVLGPLAIAVAWAAAGGVLGDMVDQAVVYNSAYAAFAPLSERIDAVVSGLRLTLPSGLAIAAVGAWLFAVATRRFVPGLLP